MNLFVGKYASPDIPEGVESPEITVEISEAELNRKGYFKSDGMDEGKAREILGDTIRDDRALRILSEYVCWKVKDQKICLDGEFAPEYLLAVAWWVENKGDK